MKVLILGVGNSLRGDDGFGPTVVKELKSEIIDPQIEILDVGTSLSLVLWPYLWDEDLPEKIIIIDAIEDGKTGLKEYDISVIPPSFFLQSSHLFPPRELLESLIKKGVEIIILGCSIKAIPNIIDDKLSEETKICVKDSVRKIKDLLNN